MLINNPKIDLTDDATLTEKQKEALKQDPIRLKPWDPMGSLAK